MDRRNMEFLLQNQIGFAKTFDGVAQSHAVMLGNIWAQRTVFIRMTVGELWVEDRGVCGHRGTNINYRR